MRISPDAQTQRSPCRGQSLRICDGFRPSPVQTRSCGLCGLSWVLHALEKLGPRRASGCGPVEVAVPGLVLDLSSLVLYGAQAVPVRLKILLDRLYSVLTPDQVGHILHTLGWSLGDYVRGYKLQDPGGRALDRWLLVSPQEEQLILGQFLRFGETRPIVQLMTGGEHAEDESRKHQRRLSAAPHGTPAAKDPVSLFHPAAQKSSEACDCPGAFRVKPDPDTPPPLPAAAAELEPPLSPLGCYSLSSSVFCPALGPGASLLAPPHSGRKGRVCCGVCGKSFYDKGTLKIHYNAVHLKIKHRCTVSGCSMVFSSLRSRNRHSANPNPRLHTCSSGPALAPHPRLHPCPGSPSQGPPRRSLPDAAPQDGRFSPVSNSSFVEDAGGTSGFCCWPPREATPRKKKSRKSSVPVKIERQRLGEM